MNKNVIRIGDLFNIEKGVLQSSKNVPGKYDFITAAETWKTHNSYSYDCEALVFAAAASGSLGRTHYVNGKFIISDLCFLLTPKDLKKHYVDLKFYHFVFNNFKEKIVKATKTGTSKDSINVTNFSNYEIPYIGETSQRLWIEKLKKAEAIQEKLLLVNYEQQTHLQQLRQAILQEAVQGKLTKQNKDDEPADKLLQRIKAEKQKLIAAGKLKKEKELPPITEDEIPFELPKGWVWCRWNDLLSFDKYSMKRGPFGSSLKKEMFGDKGIRVFEQYNPINDDPYWARYYINEKQYKELEAFTAIPGDLLISCSGATLGRITEIPEDAEFGIINQALLKLTLNKKVISNLYFLMLFRSPFLQQKILDEAGGSAIPNMVGVSVLKRILIPLPPLSEQQRILTKVQQLLQMVNQLEEQVAHSQTQAQQLLQAVLKEAFKSKGKVYEANEMITMAAAE